MRQNSTCSKINEDFKMFWGIAVCACGRLRQEVDKERFNSMQKQSLVLLNFDLRLSKTACFTMTQLIAFTLCIGQNCFAKLIYHITNSSEDEKHYPETARFASRSQYRTDELIFFVINT